MKIIKHFYRVLKMWIVSITCRHDKSHEASCPFTGMTYINCVKCWKRLGVVPTDEQANRK
jgi:hypothetical protein